jgi:hypothetical protein
VIPDPANKKPKIDAKSFTEVLTATPIQQALEKNNLVQEKSLE